MLDSGLNLRFQSRSVLTMYKHSEAPVLIMIYLIFSVSVILLPNSSANSINHLSTASLDCESYGTDHCEQIKLTSDDFRLGEKCYY